MCKKVFFKFLLFFTILFISGASLAIGLNPSYLLLEDSRVNTANKSMVLLVTPEESVSSGSKLEIFFPESEAGQWCKSNGAEVSVEGVSSSNIDLEGWNIDASLPGDLSAVCNQGSGDSIVISNIGDLSASVSYAVNLGPNANFSTPTSAGTKNIIVQLTRGLVAQATAFSIYIQDSTGMTVSGFVDQDNFTTMQVTPTTVEIGIPATIRVTTLDSKGNPIQNRDVELSLNVGNMSNWSLSPSVGKTDFDGRLQSQIIGSEVRTVTISALDKSFSSNVTIQSTATLRVRAVPTVTLNSLPLYTTGRSREVSWSSLGSGYTYKVECSKDPSFNILEQESEWISQNKFTFENLNHGESYYYRARVKNSAGFLSNYSNTVSSIQSERPSGAARVLTSTVERGIWADIEVTVVDSQGNPMSGRTIVLDVDRLDKSQWEIQQPAVTEGDGIARGKVRGFEVANAKITAVDTTQGTQTFLEGFDWLSVVDLPKPNINSLPEYSKGLTRLITWNLLAGSYNYEVESSTSSDFSNSKKSGWISGSQYVFSDLKHGEGYYYRLRARNSANVTGPYSNVVFSIQDAQAPTIEKTNFEVLSREDGKRVRFTFLVKSISSVKEVGFTCKDVYGEFVDCGSMRSVEGFHYITITEEELRAYNPGAIGETPEYTLEYCFKAEDFVGNKGSFCKEKKFTLKDPVIEKVIPEVEQTDNLMSRVFTPLRENVQKSIENTVVFIQDLEINDTTVQTASIVVASSVAPATIFTVLLNPSNYQASGQLLMGFAGIFRRKRKVLPYGYIYDSVTKESINKAIVRIYKEGKLIVTTVSNVYGVFTANLEAGVYDLKVLANDYSFPTKLIMGSVDSPLENIYKGGQFVVQEESQLQYSIPLDPVSATTIATTKTKLVSYLGKVFLGFQRVLIVVGLFVALFMYIRNPDTLNLFILLLYIPILFFHMFLSLGSKRHSFGMVKDKEGNLLDGISLGLREMEFEKLEAKRVTNNRGRYKFLVPGGHYKLEVLTPGYEIVNLKEKALYFKGNVKKPLLVNNNLVLAKTLKKEEEKEEQTQE